ncbi:unnamed protein product [Sphagnum jensenii]|uniref:Uncharacterized protein n=1 Tax=Sphagnum jensenii TaxID=128206 RepID=A0ABP1ARZ9_9BRYO
MQKYPEGITTPGRGALQEPPPQRRNQELDAAAGGGGGVLRPIWWGIAGGSSRQVKLGGRWSLGGSWNCCM